MPSTTTVTLPTGPGMATIANLTADTEEVKYELTRKVLTVFPTDGPPKEFDLSAAVTITHVISGGNSTITVTS